MRDGGPVPYEAAFEAAPDALVVLDDAGRVVLANRRAEHLLGDRRALVGRPFADLVPGGVPADGAAPVERLIRHAGGETTAEATAGRVDDPAGWTVVALRDVTGRKREEESLRARARQQARVA